MARELPNRSKVPDSEKTSGRRGDRIASDVGQPDHARPTQRQKSRQEKIVGRAESPESSVATKLAKDGNQISAAFTIDRPVAELFAFWRRFENLPQFMTHILKVTTLDEKRSHWKMRTKDGDKVYEWDAEIINEIPNEVIAWRSLEGSDVQSAGSVRFVDTGDRGTEVRVTLDYVPPGGKLGAFFQKLFGEDPQKQLYEEIRHFKQLMEAGEIAVNDSPRGSCSSADKVEGDKP
jgi:uncharacterized membrane protein